jgi:hypothetical protein
MAQAAPQTPLTLDQAMGGPKLALAIDVAAVGVGGIILYNYLKGEHRPFVGLWVVATTAALVKTFHDIGRIWFGEHRMNLTPVRIVQHGSWRQKAWAPAFMAQASPAPLPAPTQAPLWSLDGPIWAVVTDATLVTSSITLAITFGIKNSRWSSVFWGLAALSGFKTFLDLSRIYR